MRARGPLFLRAPRTPSNSTAQKQRPRDQHVMDLQGDAYQEDTIYQLGHVARVLAEMVRPDVAGANWGGYEVAKLRVAGLARSIQFRIPYLHTCSPSYCLKDVGFVAPRLSSEHCPRPSVTNQPGQIDMSLLLSESALAHQRRGWVT